ncbi:hypothetical protein CLIM01_13847 [Colletotrichum limetticola]|uniref:Uncharacterized protein n=1 Tax=Colletotrichum limetticola TaxID=1209924 RepID=A0ABQ9P9R1_9PEZI|nr:hypothetical protein CLIM01_13847 [Colletotrichum limetticola]
MFVTRRVCLTFNICDVVRASSAFLRFCVEQELKSAFGPVLNDDIYPPLSSDFNGRLLLSHNIVRLKKDEFIEDMALELSRGKFVKPQRIVSQLDDGSIGHKTHGERS